jgi:branched-subunit amino acid transport protein
VDSHLKFWLVVCTLGFSTYAIRASFILLVNGRQLKDVRLDILRFIPASVFAALSIPALVFSKSGAFEFAGMERIIAGIFAVIVAWYSKSILLTIASGMIMLWLLRWCF